MLSDRLVTFAIAATSLVVYFNSVFCGFVFDDLPAIKQNKDLKADAPWTNLLWNDYWGTPMAQERSHKSYRPLTVLTFKLNSLILGEEAWHYHAVNVIFHAVTSVLYLKVCLSLCQLCSRHTTCKAQATGKNGLSGVAAAKFYDTQYKSLKKVAYFAAALFAVHPVHCEAVTGVVGRAELLSAIFMLLALSYYAECGVRPVFFSVCFCVCAVASKEQGITVIAICVVFDFFVLHKLTPLELILFKKSSNIYTGLKSAILCLVAVCVLWWRFRLMGGTLPSFSTFDNPAAVSATPTRQLTYNYILTENFMLLLSPAHLLCDWAMGTIQLVSQVYDARNLVSVGFWCFLICLAWKAASGKEPHAKLILMGLSLLVFPFLPASNLFFPVGFVIAERVLYVPSMGFCLLVAIGVEKLFSLKRCKKFILPVFCTILFAYSAKTISRNAEWASDNSLFQSGLRVTKSNAKLWNNIGHSVEDTQPEIALLYFMEAAKVQPDDIGSYMNIGRVRKKLGDLQKAEESYRTAKALLPKPAKGKRFEARIAPDHLQLFVHLGNLLKTNMSRLEEANELYKEAVSLRYDFVDGYMNRGEILMMLNRLEAAAKCFTSALKYALKKDDLYFNLGVVHSQMGNISGAVEHYTYAIQENPNHVKALYNSAVIFEETRDPDLLRRAKIRIDRVLSLEPDNYLALSLLGSLHLDNDDEKNAAKTWLRVLEFRADDKSALFNMALMYSKKKDNSAESYKYVEQLLSHHPDHVKGLMLFGDLLLNHKKDTKASMDAFSRVIAVDPKNIQARHNYCVVILQEGRLFDAEKCLSEVYIMAPNEQYVSDNLAILRKQIAQTQKDKEVREMQFQQGIDPDVLSKSIQDEVTRRKTAEPEDFVYIEPMRKKSRSEKARDILTKTRKNVDLANTAHDQSEKLSQLENALKEAQDAIKELNTLNSEMDEEIGEKCPDKKQVPEVRTGEAGTSEQTENLRKQALDFLDELEEGLM